MNDSSGWALIAIILVVTQCVASNGIHRAADALEKIEQKMPAQR